MPEENNETGSAAAKKPAVKKVAVKKAAPKKKAEKKSKDSVKVRANRHLLEGESRKPGDEFKVTAKRFAALGKLVSKVG